MINFNEEVQGVLEQLGTRLREARLARNQSQEVFAARIGVTRQSYAKMEKGVGSIPLVNWLAASDILGRLDTWRNVLEDQADLFEQYESKRQQRKRASGSRGKK